jgi:metallo-beta-lactamase family protein
MKIKFCGAAEGVTGSCHLVSVNGEAGPLNILLDCGQFQGGGNIEAANYEPFPFVASEIDFLILSHAHVDHCGRIPLLVKRGFIGGIYCTEATADLLGVMLRDSAFIHEREAEYKTRKALRAGRKPVDPLYTIADAEESLKYLVPCAYNKPVHPAENSGAVFIFRDAGHIIGSSIVELWPEDGADSEPGAKGAPTGRKLVFSGDLGVPNHPMLADPQTIDTADIVIMESTYGSRARKEQTKDSTVRLAKIIVETAERGGTVVIPSFAVGRTQELIYELNDFFDGGGVLAEAFSNVNVYIDSPMATNATEVFHRNARIFDEEYKEKVRAGDDPLSFRNLKFTKTAEESMALNHMDEPKVIISASGMCEAGRIRHHLKHHLWRPNSSIVFVGYQAEGTLGRSLIEGAKHVKLFGDDIYVNAHIYSLEGYSGHADRNGLIAWAKAFKMPPKQFFLVHGELESKESLARGIAEETGVHAAVVTEVSEFDVN